MPYVTLEFPQAPGNLIHLNALVIRIGYRLRKTEASAEVRRLPDPLPPTWTLLADEAAFDVKVAEYAAENVPVDTRTDDEQAVDAVLEKPRRDRTDADRETMAEFAAKRARGRR